MWMYVYVLHVCVYVYVHVGHEAVASEVGLGISTFKPSEHPRFTSYKIVLLHVHFHIP